MQHIQKNALIYTYDDLWIALFSLTSIRHLQAFAYTRSATCLWTFARLQHVSTELPLNTGKF